MFGYRDIEEGKKSSVFHDSQRLRKEACGRRRLFVNSASRAAWDRGLERAGNTQGWVK
jgi:hypothetical protein